MTNQTNLQRALERKAHRRHKKLCKRAAEIVGFELYGLKIKVDYWLGDGSQPEYVDAYTYLATCWAEEVWGEGVHNGYPRLTPANVFKWAKDLQ